MVEFDDEEKMEIARKDEWVCFDQWLSEVKPWSEDFNVQSRFAWIFCHGLPIQVWNLSSFKIIANLWGEFVQVDGKTLHCSEFIRGTILIQTEQVSRIDENISVWSGDKEFVVRISEIDFNPESYQFYKNDECISRLSPRSGSDGGFDSPDGGKWVVEIDGTEVSRSLESKECDNTEVAFNVENDGKGDNTMNAFNVENDGNMGEDVGDSDRVVSLKIVEQANDFVGGMVSCGSFGSDYLLTEIDEGQSQSKGAYCGLKVIKSGGNEVEIDGLNERTDGNIVLSVG